jgi:hypothetical protein
MLQVKYLLSSLRLKSSNLPLVSWPADRQARKLGSLQIVGSPMTEDRSWKLALRSTWKTGKFSYKDGSPKLEVESEMLVIGVIIDRWVVASC